MEIRNLPDVNLASESLEVLLERNIKAYEEIILKETGTQTILYPGHPKRIEAQILTLIEYQLNHVINERAKGNLLRYATGDVLKNIGARSNTFILESQRARTTIKITLSKSFEIDYVVPIGTLFTPGNNIYFETLKAYSISPGQTVIDVQAICTSPGTVGNDLLPGQINTIASELLFIESIENTTSSFGGTNEETEDNFKERIRLAPSTYNTAGSNTAYIAMAKKFSPDVTDVYVYSSAPSTSDVVYLLKNGVPSSEQVEEMRVYLSDKSRRPNTDLVQVAAPVEKMYSISYKYYVSSVDALVEENIKSDILSAEQKYIDWQSSKIGKHINPSKLHELLMQAGALRVEIMSPAYTKLERSQIAKCTDIVAQYGGLEHDEL